MTAEQAEWFATWWPIWAPFALAIVAACAAGLWALYNRRDGEKAARTNPLPPTWPEMWARIDAQDQRIEKLERQLVEADELYDEVIHHVRTLEAGYPDPPGPPPRPWKTKLSKE